MKRVFEKTLECALVGLFLLIIACVFLQVFYRYVLNSPLTWSEELARLAFMWMLFLGLCLAEKDNIHIAVDFFLDRLPRGAQKPLRVGVELLCIVVLLAVCYYAVHFIRMQWTMRSVALNISMGYFTLAVPIGCFLYSVYKIFSIGRIMNTGDFRNTPAPEADTVAE